MREFIKTVRVGRRPLAFLFRSIYCSDANKYFVSVIDEHNAVSMFEMKTDTLGRWQLLDPVPSWIREVESELVETVSALHHDVRYLHRNTIANTHTRPPAP